MNLSPRSHKKSTMPDVAKTSSKGSLGTINKVGMGQIEMPITLQTKNGQNFLTPAKIDAYVSLDDPKAKGIHMSRLFLLTQETLTKSPLSFSLLKNLLEEFVKSQQEISQSSFIEISFDYMTQRKSLKSEHMGWRTYPITINGSLKKGILTFNLETSVIYSSTCPCSAALARQLIQNQFKKDFSTETSIPKSEVISWLGSSEGIIATPHSQRSLAQVNITLKDNNSLFFEELIDLIEGSLKTPVQSIVKREDEQEFALLNGQNLMFCEDASRRIRKTLEEDSRITDYKIRVEHQESLHPHDAVSIITKND